MSKDTKTLAVYADKAADYVKMVSSGRPDPVLDAFLGTLPVGSDILDLGSGPGHTAAKIRDLGYNVVATDASPKMAEMARDTYDLTVSVAGFEDLADVAAYDGVWASFSLLHAPKAQMPAHLAAIHRALRPGGVLSLGLKTGTGERRDSLGRFYAYYSDAEITGFLQTAGFSVADRRIGADKGLEGVEEPWIVLTARA